MILRRMMPDNATRNGTAGLSLIQRVPPAGQPAAGQSPRRQSPSGRKWRWPGSVQLVEVARQAPTTIMMSGLPPAPARRGAGTSVRWPAARTPPITCVVVSDDATSRDLKQRPRRRRMSADAVAITFCPRSWPSWPILAIRILGRRPRWPRRTSLFSSVAAAMLGRFVAVVPEMVRMSARYRHHYSSASEISPRPGRSVAGYSRLLPSRHSGAIASGTGQLGQRGVPPLVSLPGAAVLASAQRALFSTAGTSISWSSGHPGI